MVLMIVQQRESTTCAANQTQFLCAEDTFIDSHKVTLDYST